MDTNINEILKLFGLSEAYEVSELKRGHSNRTYDIKCADGRYILQSLNREIFKFPERIMHNISVIEAAFENFPESGVSVPRYIKSGGKNHAEYDGEIWRMYEYINASPEYPGKDFAHGFAVGTFLRIVNSEDLTFADSMPGLHDFNISGLPKRNIHGDTKSDNIIFGERLTIIDFDTAMVNYVPVDYGDMIRSVTAKSVDFQAIRDATAGFAKGLDGMLTDNEVSELYNGIIRIITELAGRYHEGIKNFPNKTPGQCLEREKELILQLEEFNKHEDKIINIINECFS